LWSFPLRISTATASSIAWDLTAIKNATGHCRPGGDEGFDVNGDGVVDQKDLDAMMRAVSNLCTCVIQ